MNLSFETLKGQQVKVSAPVMHLVDEGEEFEKEHEDYPYKDDDAILSRYKVIVGTEYFIYPISASTFARLSKEFD